MAAALLALSGGLSIAQPPPNEYQVKAVFLFNFAQFVEWPANSFANAQSPLIIGVLGDDPFGQALDDVVRGEKVNNHPMIVERYHTTNDLKTCHVLFISQSDTRRFPQVLTDLKGRCTLTVSDINNFVRDGGMIQFINERNKVHFRINVEAAKAANVTISSKLLRLAEVTPVGEN